MADDELIAQVYRAASGLDAWPIVLDNIAKTFTGAGIHIISVDRTSGRITLSLHTSEAPAAGIGAQGIELPARFSQLTVGADLQLGEVTNNRGHNGHGLVDTPFFRNFLMPNGACHIIGGKIYDKDNMVALLGVCRGPKHRAFGIHEEQRLGRLLTHFSNAMALMLGTREWRVRSDVGEALLGRSLRASFLVGPGAQLVYANGAGREALKQACVVVDRQGVLAARDSQADVKFKCALCALGVAGPDAAGKCPDRIPMWLYDVTCGHRVPACLWAIRAHRPATAYGGETLGMLILANAASRQRPVPDPFILGSMFGFTPAESRIAAHLIAGAAPKQIAAALDLGMPTVRQHMRQLLSKCRCQDQRHLVSRLSEALEVNGL